MSQEETEFLCRLCQKELPETERDNRDSLGVCKGCHPFTECGQAVFLDVGEDYGPTRDNIALYVQGEEVCEYEGGKVSLCFDRDEAGNTILLKYGTPALVEKFYKRITEVMKATDPELAENITLISGKFTPLTLTRIVNCSGYLGKWIKWQHTWHKCDSEGCGICTGGLGLCTVCNGAEGSLPTHCPGKKMSDAKERGVYNGDCDFIEGEWIIGLKEAKAKRDG